MNVVIKGMKFPKNCEECEFVQHGNDGWCYITEKTVPRDCMTEEKRQADCPLIEIPPHGRLIDADALMEKVMPRNEDAQFRCVALDDILTAPTILEAEVKE